MKPYVIRFSVCLFVRPSIRQTRELRQNERNFCQNYYTTRKKNSHSSFETRTMVGGGRPFLPEILGQTDPDRAETLIFNRYSLVAPQPYITPSEKSSFITNKKSTMRFPMSLRCTAHVAVTPKRAQNANKPFFVKKCTSYEESLPQSFFMWILPATNRKALNGLFIRAEMVRGGRPLLRENLAETNPPPKKPYFPRYSLKRLSRNTSRKQVQLTRIGSRSTTSFPMSLRLTAYVAPKPPKWAQKRKSAFLLERRTLDWPKISCTKCRPLVPH